jgi:cytoskeleton protein RodZ
MAPTIGSTLRKARTERGLELADVERATKIRAKFLEAMEEDRWDALPAPAYARGFLDIYARHLGLDREALLDQYSETVEDAGHEPIPGSVIKPGILRQHRSPKRALEINLKPVAKIMVGGVLLVIVGLVIVGLIGGSDDGGGGEGRAKGEDRGRQAAPPATPTTTTTTPAGEVSVELQPTGTVWVCLVDDAGEPLVDSETLTIGDSRGPFTASGFEVTFGNGSVEMTVDGGPEQIPEVAEPIGYRITPSGVRELNPSSQPTCL